MGKVKDINHKNVKKTTSNLPFKISEKFAKLSPMKTVEKVKLRLKQYKKDPSSVGFTIKASLKSMGLIKRSDGTYRLGEKYAK